MKKNIVITIVVLVFSLVGILLGGKSYSYEKNMKGKFNIYFNNLKTSIINGNAYVPESPEIDGASIKAYDVLIKKRGDFATFTFNIINDGNVDAKLSNLIKIKPKCISLEIPPIISDEELVCNNLEYIYYYTKNNREVGINDVIDAGAKESIAIKVGLSSNVLNDPESDVQIALFDTTFVYNEK